MNLHDLLAHHGMVGNPFADEDAQTDPVFQGRCRTSTFHPEWDKVYGDPAKPATSIVFGEKGAGKTALRLQMVAQIEEFNALTRTSAFVIEYDDFNPFLDRFADDSAAANGGILASKSGSCGTTWTRSSRWASRPWSTACWKAPEQLAGRQ